MNTLKGDSNEENGFTRNYCDCCINKRGCPKNVSTKESQIWSIRNNSSNVSSLLAPDFEEKSDYNESNSSFPSKFHPKRVIKSANLASKRSETPIHCDTCYCRDSPNLPLFDLRPRHENDFKCKKSVAKTNLREFCRQKRGHGVKRIVKVPDIKSNTINSITNDEYLKLDYTDTRSDYELRNNEFKKVESSKKICEDYDNGDVSLQLNNIPMTYKEFKELSDFRKEQYFDCHSSTNMRSETIKSQHKCVHKFIINDRLLPEPVNCDSYGVSRCEVCNKPMDTFEKATKLQHSSKKKPINKVKQIYEYNLSPPRLNISNGNETVQIKVPEKLGKECLWQCPDFKIKRKVPGNSYALRYQKGCF